MPSCVALIPARSGSKRVPHKNVRPLGGRPLLAWTIAAAQESGIFQSIIVSTDSPRYRRIAQWYGAEIPFLRPRGMAGDHSHDFAWVDYTLAELRGQGREWDAFSILRPTSPFRTPETIRRAWAQFASEPAWDSLRAVELCRQHPAKMWLAYGQRLVPLLPVGLEEGQPGHSRPYQTLPETWVQNASLEIAWTRVLWAQRTIAGTHIMAFHTEGFEGFDINNEWDWLLAEKIAVGR